MIKEIRFGRSSSNDVMISNTKISREHTKITYMQNGDFILEDLNSANGTYINDKRVFGRVPISPGDKVRLADVKLDWEIYFREYLRFTQLKTQKIQTVQNKTNRSTEKSPPDANDHQKSSIHQKNGEKSGNKKKSIGHMPAQSVIEKTTTNTHKPSPPSSNKNSASIKKTSPSIPQQQATPKYQLATREERFWAWLIDILAFYVPFIAFAYSLEAIPNGDGIGVFASLGAILAVIIRQIMLSSLYGQSMGKKYVNIKVVNKDNLKNSGFVINVIIRRFILYIPAISFLLLINTADTSNTLDLILVLSIIFWLFDSLFVYQNNEYQSIHDKLANTIVIKADKKK